jgi:hypothetical protein
LVEKDSILVSTVSQQRTGKGPDETTVFGQGFDDGVVTIVR